MNKIGFALLFIIFAVSVTAKETLEFPTLMGDLIAPEEGNITIHIVPHTHDDIGWLKTVDQYYIDSEKGITIQGVQYILDSVFPILQLDSSKRFIYVEIGFFKRWWNEQNDNMKNLVKQLVQSGQLEFINGGYCMNDEAAVYYEDSIDQMTFGHKFILDNFGVTPQVGWHIDPFGHASAQAALFAQMGFKAFFFARIDYQDKTNRLNNQGMEMIWIPNTSQGIENAMFTHVNYYHYSNPANFNFDIIAGDDPVQDDLALEGYNADQMGDQFVAWFRQMEANYRAPHLFHTAGDDFEYMAAGMNYKNYDKVFNYVRNNPSYNVNVRYSTPSDYLNLIGPLGITYPQKTDDFFPYADGDSAYWTGYFTSRVAIKGYIRQEGRLLQAAKRLATQVTWDQSSQFVANNFTQVDQALAQLEEAMAMCQHHDAVTGTEKQAVTEDYKLHLAGGDNAMKQGFLFPLLQEQIQRDVGLQNLQLSTCNLNTSTIFCPATESLTQGNSVLVTVFNSATARQSTIRVKVPSGNVQVTRINGDNIATDVICANSTDTTDCDLFFTDDLQGLTTSYYYLVPISTSNAITAQGLAYNQAYRINGNQTFKASSLSGFSFQYCNNGDNDCYSTAFNLNYNYYESYQVDGQQKSGAYIFRPDQRTFSGSISYDTQLSGKVYIGKNLIQVQLHGSKTITAMRIYNDLTNGIEVQTFVDSIDVSDNQGKEIVMVVNVPSINNNKIFYTDSMGMELQERILNYRPTWNLTVTQPVAGNYYPIQSTIKIQDINSNESLAVIPDRAEGGGSISNGEIEIMIHRRLTGDDGRGVGEALNETDWDGKGMRQWVTHTLLFNKPNYISTSHRQVQLTNDVANIVVLAPVSKAVFTELNQVSERRITDVIDARVKAITRPLSTSQFLLRFQNMDENESLNVPTTVFTNPKFSSGSVVEQSLTNNQAKTDMLKKRTNWNGLDLNNPAYANTDYLNSNQFLLRPLEIRTFLLSFGSSTNEFAFEDIISI